MTPLEPPPELEIMRLLRHYHGRDAAAALMTLLGVAAILISKCDDDKVALAIAQRKLGELVK